MSKKAKMTITAERKRTRMLQKYMSPAQRKQANKNRAKLARKK